MSGPSTEARARAFALRALGYSYREIEGDIRETLKESVDHNTIARWCNEDSDLQAKANKAKLQRMVDRDTEIGVRAGELLDDMLPKLGPRDMATTYGINRDKVQGWLRIIQDERRDNELLTRLRAELRHKPPEELLADFRAAQEPPPPDRPPEVERHREERHARDAQLERYQERY
jgi:hypothetical protein